MTFHITTGTAPLARTPFENLHRHGIQQLVGHHHTGKAFWKIRQPLHPRQQARRQTHQRLPLLFAPLGRQLQNPVAQPGKPGVVQRIEQLGRQHAGTRPHLQHHRAVARQRRIAQPGRHLPGQRGAEQRRQLRRRDEVTRRPENHAGVAVIAQPRLVQRHFHVARKRDPATHTADLRRDVCRQLLAGFERLGTGHGQGMGNTGMRQGHDRKAAEREIPCGACHGPARP